MRDVNQGFGRLLSDRSAVRICPSPPLHSIEKKTGASVVSKFPAPVIQYRLMRTLALALFFALGAFAQQVEVEFDESVNFSKFKTFAIREGELNSKSPALNSELVKKRIEAEIESRLAAKGLVKATGQADLNVRYRLGAGNRTEVETYPAGWRGLRTRRVAVRRAEGTLVIDLRDTSKRELVWRAISTEEENNPLKLAGKIDDMVRKSIDRYPPKKK